MSRLITITLLLALALSCDRAKDQMLLFPSHLISTRGEKLDSMIRSHKYTALVLHCDNCGKGVSDLYYWDQITKENANIHPLILIKSDNPRLIETYLDIYHVNYPRVIYDFDSLKLMNPGINPGNTILIDSLYHIITLDSPLNNKLITWKYTHSYK